MSLLSRWFADISVGGKLVLGFALVLLLTVGVTATALLTQRDLLRSGEILTDVAAVNTGVLQARVAERQFALSRDSAQADAVRQALDTVDSRLALLPHEYFGQQRWVAIAKASGGYLRQFQGFSRLQLDAHEARLGMQAQAREAAERFDSVFFDLIDVFSTELEQSKLSADDLQRLEQAAGLMRKLIKVRDSETLFILEQSEEQRSAWEMAMSDTEAAIDSLSLHLDQSQLSLQAARDALGLYRESFERYSVSHRSSAASAVDMAMEVGQVIELAAGAYAAEEQHMQQVGQRAWFLLGGSALLAVGLGIMACWIIRQCIVSPLQKTLHIAQRVARGELSGELTAVLRKDELGRLQAVVQDMVLGLRGLVSRIESGVIQLSGATGELSMITDQTRSGVGQQREESDQTTAAMAQMAIIAQKVTGHADHARRASESASQQAKEGNQVVGQASRQMSYLAQEIEGFAEVMQQLQLESVQIAGVLDVIKSVAEQTNLLALNASIEAARAGEHGRGFAVVADEVRELSRRTQNSTVKIEGLVSRLRDGADSAVQRMTESRVLTHDAANSAEQAGLAFSEIAQAIGNIELLNQQIVAAAKNQSVMAEQVTQSAVRVRDVIERSADVGERLISSSEGLGQLGQELMQAVGHFKS